MSILKITVPYSHFVVGAEGNNLTISIQYPYQIFEEQTLIELSPTDEEMPELNKSLDLPLPIPKIEIVDASSYKLPRIAMYTIKRKQIDDILSKIEIRKARANIPHTSTTSTKRTQVYQVNTGKSTIDTIGVIYFEYKKARHTPYNFMSDLKRYLIEPPKKMDIIDDGDHYDIFLIYDKKEDLKSELVYLEYEKMSEADKGYNDIMDLKSMKIGDELPPDVLVFTFNNQLPSALLESAVNSLLAYVKSKTNNIIKILTTSTQVYIFFSDPQIVDELYKMAPFQLGDGVTVTVEKNPRY